MSETAEKHKKVNRMSTVALWAKMESLKGQERSRYYRDLKGEHDARIRNSLAR